MSPAPRPRWRPLLPACSVLAAALLTATACSESDCERYRNQLCERACACGDCVMDYGGVQISWESESDCKTFYNVFVCDQEGDMTDYPGCLEALESATCEPDADGDLVLMHPACDMGNGGSGLDAGI